MVRNWRSAWAGNVCGESLRVRRHVDNGQHKARFEMDRAQSMSLPARSVRTVPPAARGHSLIQDGRASPTRSIPKLRIEPRPSHC